MNSELSATADADIFCAHVLDESDEEHRRLLDELRADPAVDFIDTRPQQVASLRELRPRRGAELLEEPTRWAYYPWRRTVVGILGPKAFRALRLDRNRNIITTDEQGRLGTLRIGIVGLSVGHVIAHTIATEGSCGELRLADFDELELSNLNRVPATVLDLGLNKATVAARRIAELDPYLPVRAMTSGLHPHSIGDFLDGLDIVIEECDSLDMKIVVREAARARRLPVLMATSDRGLIDVERFDTEPDRPILHGLLGATDSASLSGLSTKDKIPHMLNLLDARALSAQAAASMVEVGTTLSSWPQLAGEVVLGATAVAEAVRRIGLGAPLASGRVRIDIAAAFDSITAPTPPVAPTSAPPRPAPDATARAGANHSAVAAVVAAAVRAPSAGNAQPWHIDERHNRIGIRIAPESTSTLDIDFRCSAVALGAAVFNARVAAAAHSSLGPVEVIEGGADDPLHAVVRLGDADDPALADLYQPMLVRETNRRHGVYAPLPTGIGERLTALASAEGARLRLLTSRAEIARAADVIAATDRIRYLTPKLHEEMVHELRWPGDGDPDTGIEVDSLEFDAADRAALAIIRRPDVMSHLAKWDGGVSLGDDTLDKINASSALAMVMVSGGTLVDYARGGAAAEAVWIAAQHQGLAVQPVSPLFLYARDDADLHGLSPGFTTELGELRRTFLDLAGTSADEALVLVLRFADAPQASIRSRRRRVAAFDLPLAAGDT